MFGKLTIFALALGTVSTAGAQSADLIIRRSGQKDQVIHLDEKQMQAMTGKLSDQLQGALKNLKELDLAHQGDFLRFNFDSGRFAANARLLADRAGEISMRVAPRAAEMARTVPGMMTRVIRDAMTQPRIGIYVDNSGSQDSDKYGALVASVSPGGPADKAGIRSGDILTKVDGKSLAATGAKDEALPGVRLIEIVTKLPVGKPVTVEYRRGTTTNTTKVTPVEMDDEITLSGIASPNMVFRSDTLRTMLREMPGARPGTFTRLPMPTLDQDGMTVFSNTLPGGNLSWAFSNGGAISNLELVSLNEKLGSYFGTSEGVLVVNVGEKDAFNLQPGDVVVSVDGRKVGTSSQLMRILRTYQKGEEYKIQIMRQKKAETLTGKLP